MAYTLNKLITNAFYLSKIRSKDYQTVGGDDTAIGLDLFNKVLAHHSANTRMIPYNSSKTIDAVIGQEEYFIEHLVEPMSLTFNLDTVRYPVEKISRERYHASGGVEGFNSLPYECNFERTLKGCDLYIYPTPADTYPLHIWGKYNFNSVGVSDLPTDMLLVYDLYYIDYLESLLAKRLCSYYGHPVDPEVQQIIDKISSNINSMNYIDITPKRINLYGGGGSVDWMSYNLSRGYSPTGY